MLTFSQLGGYDVITEALSLPMAAFANRVRGRVPLEKDFAQERADWCNVMPAYLLLTEREFSTYNSQSLAKVSSLPVQSNLQLPRS